MLFNALMAVRPDEGRRRKHSVTFENIVWFSPDEMKVSFHF